MEKVNIIRVMNFTSFARRTNFAQFVPTAWQFERAWPTVLLFSERKRLQRSSVISGNRCRVK